MNIITRELVKKILTQIVTADLDEDGVLVDAKIGLYTARGGVPEVPLYTDFTVPEFDGYEDSAAVVYGAPFIDEEGTYHVSTDLKQFQCDGGAPDESVIGAFVYTGAPASEKVLWYEEFAEAVEITHVGDGLRYAASLRLAFDGDYGSGVLLA